MYLGEFRIFLIEYVRLP